LRGTGIFRRDCCFTDIATQILSLAAHLRTGMGGFAGRQPNRSRAPREAVANLTRNTEPPPGSRSLRRVAKHSVPSSSASKLKISQMYAADGQSSVRCVPLQTPISFRNASHWPRADPCELDPAAPRTPRCPPRYTLGRTSWPWSWVPTPKSGGSGARRRPRLRYQG